jgi:AraC-like DNA-binding protein
MFELLFNLTSGIVLTLGIILFYNPLKTNKKGVRFISLFFLLIFSTSLLDDLTRLSIVTFPLEDQISLLISSLTPLFFYLAIHFFINPSDKFFSSYNTFLLSLSFLVLLASLFNESIAVFIYIVNVILIIVLCLYEFNKFNKKIALFSSDTSSINLWWLKRTLFFVTILASIEILGVLEVNFINGYQVYFMLAEMICFIFIGYNSLCQTEIYPTEIIYNQIKTGSLLEFNIDTEVNSDELINLEKEKEKIHDFIITQKSYLQPNLNIRTLANDLDTTIHKISFIINKGFQTNFNQFINSYRIEEAKTLLKNPNYQNYTIEAIAYESGFNSKASFNIAFKKITEVTPSEFKIK